MRLLIVDLLPEGDETALAAIRTLREGAEECRVIHAYEKNLRPCVDRFAAPEDMPPSQIRLYDLVFKHVSRFFMGRVAKKLGCRDRLDARPYEACLPATEKP